MAGPRHVTGQQIHPIPQTNSDVSLAMKQCSDGLICLRVVTDSSHIVCKVSVCVRVGCLSVCPSVCLSRRSTAAATCCWFAAYQMSIDSCRRHSSVCGQHQCCMIDADLFLLFLSLQMLLILSGRQYAPPMAILVLSGNKAMPMSTGVAR